MTRYEWRTTDNRHSRAAHGPTRMQSTRDATKGTTQGTTTREPRTSKGSIYRRKHYRSCMRDRLWPKPQRVRERVQVYIHYGIWSIEYPSCSIRFMRTPMLPCKQSGTTFPRWDGRDEHLRHVGEGYCLRGRVGESREKFLLEEGKEKMRMSTKDTFWRLRRLRRATTESS